MKRLSPTQLLISLQITAILVSSVALAGCHSAPPAVGDTTTNKSVATSAATTSTAATTTAAKTTEKATKKTTKKAVTTTSLTTPSTNLSSMFSTSRMWYKGTKSIIKIAMNREVTKTNEVYKKVIEQYEKEKFVPIVLDDTRTFTIKPKDAVKSTSANVAKVLDGKDELLWLRLHLQISLDEKTNEIKVYCNANSYTQDVYSYWVRVDTGDPKVIYVYHFRAQNSG